MTKTRIIVGLAALAALGGCQGLQDMTQPAPRPVAAPSHPTYCYRTLAAVNCYLTPRPGDTLVGIDVPPPLDQLPVAAAPAPTLPGAPAAAAISGPASAPAAPSPAQPEAKTPAPPSSNGPVPLSPYGNGSRRSQE